MGFLVLYDLLQTFPYEGEKRLNHSDLSELHNVFQSRPNLNSPFNHTGTL